MSASYTEEFLVDKLNKLVNTQESIQTLSEWVKFHKKKCKQSVEVWDRELYNAPKERKLVFLYLANDIMQTSRKKGGEFIQEFGKALPRAIVHVYRECEKEEKKAVSRLLNIWRERRVFPAEFIDNITKSMTGHGPTEQLVVNLPVELDPPPVSTQTNKGDPLSVVMREVASKEVELALADEKVQAIRPELMSGAAMVTCLNQIEVTELAIELDEAINVLNGLQKSLEEDLKSRTKLIEAVKVYLEAQLVQKENAQKRIQDCKQELVVTEQLKDELKNLYEKLPAGPTEDQMPADPRQQAPPKRDSAVLVAEEDAASPGKRAKTLGANPPPSMLNKPPPLLPNPLPARTITNPPLNLPNNTIIANQSYYTPLVNDYNNTYTPNAAGIPPMPVPGYNNVNNAPLNNQHYQNNNNNHYNPGALNGINMNGLVEMNPQDLIDPNYTHNPTAYLNNVDQYTQLSNFSTYGHITR